jgi:hypothetical protein
MGITSGSRGGPRVGRTLSLGVAAACVVAVVVGPGVASATPVAATITGYTISVGASTAITPGQSVAADAFCRPGKVVLSGGVMSHSPQTFIRTSYPLDPQTWQIVATDMGNETYTEHFTPYAICVDAASVPGYRQIQTAQLPVGPDTYYGPNIAAGDAYCDPSEVVVGGGVRSHFPTTLLTVSRPTTDNRAWEVFVHMVNPPPYDGEYYQVSAVCIPSADVSSYTIRTAAFGAYGTNLATPIGGGAARTNTAGTPYCGAGQLALAAGASNHDTANGFISSVAPSGDPKYWLVTDTDLNPPSYGESFYPTSICASATT